MGKKGKNMEQAKIDRINELARKSRAEGLSVEEQQEQQALRREYIDAMKNSLHATLKNTVIVRPDGTRQKVEKRDKE